MAKSLLYRLFGFGKLPESERPIATGEELLLDEGIRGSIRFDHFRAPGKRYHKKVSWFPGSLMITGNRFAAFAFSRSVIDIPLEGEYLRKLQYQLDDKQRLEVRFKAEDFQPDSSGEIECRFNTPYAADFLARLRQAADYERGELRAKPPPRNLLFYEEQRPHWIWTWGISLLLLGYLAWVAEGFYQQLFLGIPWGNKPASDELFSYLMAGIAIFTAGMIAMLLNMRLEVQVRRNGLFVQLFPFHLRKPKRVDLTSMIDSAAVTYHPIRDYGGWGIRSGRTGKAYNMRGTRGVRLIFRKGKPLLIGSQRADDLALAIMSMAGKRDR